MAAPWKERASRAVVAAAASETLKMGCPLQLLGAMVVVVAGMLLVDLASD